MNELVTIVCGFVLLAAVIFGSMAYVDVKKLELMASLVELQTEALKHADSDAEKDHINEEMKKLMEKLK